MANEYKLSYTGSEINERLGKIDELEVETIRATNLLDGVTWTTGFYYGSGQIATNLAEAVNGTRYSDKIPVNSGDVLTLVYTVPIGRASNMWQAICEFDNNNNWIRRIGGSVTGIASGDFAIYTKEYIVPEGVGYLVLCGRGIYDWTTPIEFNASNKPTGVLRLERKEIQTISRLLPLPTVGNEGKTPVVTDGVYTMQTMQTPELIVEYLSGREKNDLMSMRAWTAGFLYDNGNFASTDEGAYYGHCAYTDLFPVTSGETYHYIYKVPANIADREGNIKNKLELTFNEYKYEGGWLRRNILTLPASNIVDGYEVVEGEYTIPEDVDSIRVTCYTFRADYNGSKVLSIYADGDRNLPVRLLPILTSKDEGKVLSVKDGQYVLNEPLTGKNINSSIRAINHRGYCIEAPENTLSAYRLSKKMGFEYVECDVSFTSDGHAVLLHDGTIDRTSNGSGDISTLTLNEVKSLDFGSWFSAEYAGEQIPTFKEFIQLCKHIGLHPYIEIKGNISAERASELVAIVKRYGMQGKVTWISFYPTALTNIKNVDPFARLGFVSESGTEETIARANELKTEDNEVFLNMGHYALSDTFINSCIENNLPLEVWTVNSEDIITNLDPYISGVTSDSLIAGEVMYNFEMES